MGKYIPAKNKAYSELFKVSFVPKEAPIAVINIPQPMVEVPEKYQCFYNGHLYILDEEGNDQAIRQGDIFTLSLKSKRSNRVQRYVRLGYIKKV